MGSPRLTSLSCSILILLPGDSGQLISCSWRYRGLYGTSEEIEPFPLPVLNYGTASNCTLDKPFHCPFLKLSLKLIFIPWLLTQHETLFLFLLYCFYCFNIVIVYYCFYIVLMFYVLYFVLLFMYITLFQPRLFLKGFINKVELS